MSIVVKDEKFCEAMTALVLWRSQNPDAKKEPEEIIAHRSHIMLRASTLREGDIDPWMGKEVVVLIRKSTRYVVYLDDKLDIQWWWAKRLNKEDVLNVVQANVTRLTSASNFLLVHDLDLRLGIFQRTRIWGWVRRKVFGPLPNNQSLIDRAREESWTKAKEIRSFIAESMAMVLNSSPLIECEKVQAMAEHQILIEKDQLCRGYFMWQFGIAFTFFAILAAAARYSGACGLVEVAESNVGLTQAALAGAFGAFVSAMTRTRQLALEPESGRKGLRAEAFARALIGGGAAILAYFAFEGQIILKGALSSDLDVQEAIKFFLCIAAGASERILPNLIVRAESLIDGGGTSKGDKGK